MYSYEQSLTDSQWYEFKIAYSIIYTDIIGTVTFDNGIDAPTVENIAFDSFSGVITVPYVAVATGDGNSRPLVNLPIPCTMIKTIVLTPGTYNFVVNFSSWAGTLEVNTDPTEYVGYNNDTEAMLSKLNILVFNN